MQERFPQYEFEAGAEEKSTEEIDNTKVGPFLQSSSGCLLDLTFVQGDKHGRQPAAGLLAPGTLLTNTPLPVHCASASHRLALHCDW